MTKISEISDNSALSTQEATPQRVRLLKGGDTDKTCYMLLAILVLLGLIWAATSQASTTTKALFF